MKLNSESDRFPEGWRVTRKFAGRRPELNQPSADSADKTGSDRRRRRATVERDEVIARAPFAGVGLDDVLMEAISLAPTSA